MIDRQQAVVDVIRDERPAAPQETWRPSDEALREFGYVKAFVTTYNPLPMIRASYGAGGAWWWAAYVAYLSYAASWIGQ